MMEGYWLWVAGLSLMFSGRPPAVIAGLFLMFAGLSSCVGAS